MAKKDGRGPCAHEQKTATAKTKRRPAADLSYIAAGLRRHAVPITELAFFEENPRKHGAGDLAATKASLRTFGQVELLVVNRRSSPPVVLNGNGRLQAARELNWSHVAVHFVDLDEGQAAALALALNRTGELAGWDAEHLAAALAALDTNNDAVLDDMIAALAEEVGLFETPAPPPSRPAPDQSAQLTSQFQVLVTCVSEEQQAELLARLQAEGLECRSLIA